MGNKTDLGNGVFLEKQNGIQILTLAEDTRDGIDTFYGTLHEIVQNWDSPDRANLLVDLRHAAFTSYGSQKSRDFLNSLPDTFTANFAMLVPASAVGIILQGLINANSRLLQKRVNQRVFREYDKAMEWLKDTA